jgi:hypothetical protein
MKWLPGSSQRAAHRRAGGVEPRESPSPSPRRAPAPASRRARSQTTGPAAGNPRPSQGVGDDERVQRAGPTGSKACAYGSASMRLSSKSGPRAGSNGPRAQAVALARADAGDRDAPAVLSPDIATRCSAPASSSRHRSMLSAVEKTEKLVPAPSQRVPARARDAAGGRGVDDGALLRDDDVAHGWGGVESTPAGPGVRRARRRRSAPQPSD